jgi:hypothetical protein
MRWDTERKRNQCLSRSLLKSERRNGESGAPQLNAEGARLGTTDAGERLDEDLPDLRLKGAGDVC